MSLRLKSTTRNIIIISLARTEYTAPTIYVFENKAKQENNQIFSPFIDAKNGKPVKICDSSQACTGYFILNRFLNL
jgi:hypothetical protein